MSGLELFRSGYGAVQLVLPHLISERVAGLRLDDRAAAVVRVLGARHLLQAVAVSAVQAVAEQGSSLSGTAHRLGAAVDVLHSASMVLLALADAKRRRAALMDAAVACLFAAAEFSASRQRGMPRSGR
ncbi:hypothetical protein IV500_10885 [Paeniglutamicibacter antarcticus]|uniref:Uncharacterized protein n=1 Tax=Arthrobacter terrae TaxID=2935737 RepID=A0A931CRZ6_9MICC|nr:hypothetical protein [Arthrobacter terrae]MBG0739891.1 hypothetical protein [Arthrobacter terrae]